MSYTEPVASRVRGRELKPSGVLGVKLDKKVASRVRGRELKHDQPLPVDLWQLSCVPRARARIETVLPDRLVLLVLVASRVRGRELKQVFH